MKNNFSFFLYAENYVGQALKDLNGTVVFKSKLDEDEKGLLHTCGPS